MWEVIALNRRKSVFLMFLMAVLLCAVGAAFGDYFTGFYLHGVLLACTLWLILSAGAYFQGRNIFLKISGARKITREDHPRLFNIVEEMKIASALPAMPGIYIIDDPAPNAFAAGRSPETAAVAVTTGLLNTLNRNELQGVIAHEIGHVVNRDTLFMSMVGVMVGTVVILAEIARRTLFFGNNRSQTRTSAGKGQAQIIILAAGLALMIISPLLARIIYLAASRKREYLADASAAVYTRFPEGLAAALEKISGSSLKMQKVNAVTAPMFIVNPIKKKSKKKKRDSIFSTHPSSDNRIRILRSMAGGTGYMSYDESFRRVTGHNRPFLPASALQDAAVKPEARDPKKEPAHKTMKPGIDTIILAGTILAQSFPEPNSPASKARETCDALWKSRGYHFITCTCGAVLKIPPELQQSNIPCLRCRRIHPSVNPHN